MAQAEKRLVLCPDGTITDEDGLCYMNEDQATFVFDGKKLIVSVAEEHAVDSYNQTFTCSLHLNEAQTRELYEFIRRGMEG